jgi:hypothetical protein
VKASNTDPDDVGSFGESVALSREMLVVGAHGESGSAGINGNQADNNCLHAGAVYV